MLSRIDFAVNAPQALVLSPTRELARQISDRILEIGKFTGVTTVLAVKESGKKRGDFIKEHVIVGTPGTVLDWLSKKIFDVKKIKVFVLDEADQMIDQQGLGDQSLKVRRELAPTCQILLFSATYPQQVKDYAMRLVPNPNLITLKVEELTVKFIKQFWVQCPTEEVRYQHLTTIYGFNSHGQVIIFCQTRNGVLELCNRLRSEGHKVEMLFGGDMDSTYRDKVIDDFRSSRVKVLITTNVLARGIDISQVTFVINYDVPTKGDGSPDAETYLHRIGRTGRFGHRGVAVTFCDSQDNWRKLMSIKDALGTEIPKLEMEDLEAVESQLAIA
eukprot:Colp12_sorted_trinity150504_noHs@12615